MNRNDDAALFVLHRGNVSGPYTVAQVRRQEICDRFAKVSRDRETWQEADLFLSEFDLRSAAPSPVVPPTLPGILAVDSQWPEQGVFYPFPVVALILLHFLTLGIYSFVTVTGLHGKLPRIKSDDPSGTKAIAFCFVPIYGFYWIFVVYLRLATRLNALSLHYHLPIALPMPLAWTLCVLMIPGVMAAMGGIILAVLLFSPDSTSEVMFLFFGLPSILIAVDFLLIMPVYAGLAQRAINRVADAQLSLLGRRRENLIMRTLREEITCTHCWHRFAPHEVLWYSEHPDLGHDPLLGENSRLCFLPNRFDLKCYAFDARGLVCRDLACPHCHLAVPHSLLEREPLFVSILGTPTCGKSYYLSALVASLRRELPLHFQLEFTDADTVSNRVLAENEQMLFVHQNPNAPVELGELIKKTQLGGQLYDNVRYGDQNFSFARPFSFLLGPLTDHPNFKRAASLERLVALYDNAGEHFLSGADSSRTPGTRHLAESNFLLFLFDPTQDSRWHAAMQRLHPSIETPKTDSSSPQEVVLREASQRTRKLLGLPDGAKIKRPLFVVISKFDVWEREGIRESWDRVLRPGAGERLGVDFALLKELSDELRRQLMAATPEVVLAAEQAYETVYYAPATVLGKRPEIKHGKAWIHPRYIKPWGVSLPFLVGLSLSVKGMVAIKPAHSNTQSNGI